MKSYIRNYGGLTINIFLFLALVLAPLPVRFNGNHLTNNESVSAQQTQDITPVPIPTKTNGSPITTVDNILSVFKNALRFTAILFWIAAIGCIFYSAYLFLMAGGDPKLATTARNYLFYAMIAMAIGITAYAFPLLVKNILSEGGSPSSLPIIPPTP